MGYLQTRFKLRGLQPGWSITETFEVRNAEVGETVSLKVNLGASKVSFRGEVPRAGLVLVHIKNTGQGFVGHEPVYLEIRTDAPGARVLSSQPHTAE